MKLLRFGPPGQEQPGILDSAGNIRSLAGIIDDLAGDDLSPASLEKLRSLDLSKLPLTVLHPSPQSRPNRFASAPPSPAPAK